MVNGKFGLTRFYNLSLIKLFRRSVLRLNGMSGAIKLEIWKKERLVRRAKIIIITITLIRSSWKDMSSF